MNTQSDQSYSPRTPCSLPTFSPAAHAAANAMRERLYKIMLACECCKSGCLQRIKRTVESSGASYQDYALRVAAAAAAARALPATAAAARAAAVKTQLLDSLGVKTCRSLHLRLFGLTPPSTVSRARGWILYQPYPINTILGKACVLVPAPVPVHASPSSLGHQPARLLRRASRELRAAAEKAASSPWTPLEAPPHE